MTVISKKETTHFEISLNRPEKRNAFNEELMKEMKDVLKDFSENIEGQKYLLLTGEGKSFSAGADLEWMKAMAGYSKEENERDSYLLFDLFKSLYDFPLPVITLAQGHVFGGALGLLAASDFVYVNEDTKLCFSEVKLGLSPAVISSFVLAKAHSSKATELMLSARVFKAQEAVDVSLATSTDFNEKDQLIENLKASGTEALIETKKLVRLHTPVKPESYKDKTVSTIAELRVSDEAQKRMKAFLEKARGK